MTLDTRLATVVTGFGAAAGADNPVVAERVTCAAIIGDTTVGEVAASVRASAKTAMGPGDWVATAGSATDWTVRVDTDVFGWSAALVVAVVLSTGFGFAFGFGLGVGVFVGSGPADLVGSVVGSVVGFVSVVPDVPVLVCALTTPLVGSVVVAVVPVVGVPLPCSGVDGSVDGSVDVCVLVLVVVVFVSVDPLAVDVSDDGEFDVASSADAMPYPVAIAVPTPNATANPPTRPI